MTAATASHEHAMGVVLPRLMAALGLNQAADDEREFGILSPGTGEVHDVTRDQAGCAERLADYRRFQPDADMVVRTVHRSTWTTTRRPEVAA